MDKPYKGEISNWRKAYFPSTHKSEQKILGYVIVGCPHGHPDFKAWIITSAVVSHDETTGEVETLNSRYTLVAKQRSFVYNLRPTY